MTAHPSPLDIVDPITLQVIGSAFESIADEMGEVLVRTSFSTNIKERRDCSSGLFDADGQTLCQAEHIPMHLGSFIGIVPEIMRRHPVAEMQPGDVFVANDPYAGGGTHLPDLVLAEPIFVDGVLVAWAVNLAHHSDFADRGHRHVFQEGLRIPPIRLYAAGGLRKDVLDLILLNCQVPDERISDLDAQSAANRLGVRRITELCRKYGRETVTSAGRALQDYAERKMRAGIQRLPDGVYTFHDKFDQIRSPGVADIGVTIEIKGDAIELDFSAPPQTASASNMTRTALLATVYYALKSLVDPTILPNAGLGRPITVRAPSGTIVNCTEPAAVDGRLSVCQRVVEVIYGALAAIVPERVTAASTGGALVIFSGNRPGDGKYWVYLESIGGGGGARYNRDGLHGVQVHMTNTSNLPVEAMEGEYPLSILRYELVDGSGGEGRFQGGMGLRRLYRVDADCQLAVGGARVVTNPWGLEGGGEGNRFECLIDGVPLRDSGTVQLRAGQIVDIRSSGGGGYGARSA